MLEPDVALTDYLLAAETALFAWLLWRPRPGSDLRTPFVVFFAATSVGALAGGTVHGFFPSSASGLGATLWRVTLLSVGVTALCGWFIGAPLLFAPRGASAVRFMASAVFVAYAAVILGVDDSFRVAVVHYLPATVFLLMAFGAAYRATRTRSMAMGIAGLAATLAAPAIQQFRLALHPTYFGYNALYHTVEAAALLMIFLAAQSIVQPRT